MKLKFFFKHRKMFEKWIRENTIILSVNSLKKRLGLSFLKFKAELKKNWHISLISEGELIPLNDYLKEKNDEISLALKQEVKKCVVVQWILGCHINSRNLYILKNQNRKEVVSLDFKIDYENFEIPSSMMKKWFSDSWDEFLKTFKKLLPDRKSVDFFCDQCREVIFRLSPEQVWWIKFIKKRCREIKK